MLEQEPDNKLLKCFVLELNVKNENNVFHEMMGEY